jgi:hypothetical protein
MFVSVFELTPFRPGGIPVYGHDMQKTLGQAFRVLRVMYATLPELPTAERLFRTGKGK